LTDNPQLNGPMLERLRACADDTSSDRACTVNIYPHEARQIVALIGRTAGQSQVAAVTDADIALVAGVLPVDLIDGQMAVRYRTNGEAVWGPPESVAAKILEVLAGRLIPRRGRSGGCCQPAENSEGNAHDERCLYLMGLIEGRRQADQTETKT
jgi:hypothetical protein